MHFKKPRDYGKAFHPLDLAQSLVRHKRPVFFQGCPSFGSVHLNLESPLWVLSGFLVFLCPGFRVLVILTPRPTEIPQAPHTLRASQSLQAICAQPLLSLLHTALKSLY